MRIIINHSSMIPIYEQIVDQIKKQINNHTLKENDALPSVRSLAKELHNFPQPGTARCNGNGIPLLSEVRL